VVIEEAASAVGRPHKTLEQPKIPGNSVVEPSLSGENSPPPYRLLGNMEKEEGNITNETDTFGFPILDMAKDIAMNNIPLSSLPHFCSMSTEDPDSFLFEFDILCRSYNYTDNAKKLKLFPATLKDLALWWFMSLGEHTILSWDGMKETFLLKYQYYCIPRDARNDIFKMQQSEEEILEGYLERFLYNYQKTKKFSLDTTIVRNVFLKGVRDDCIEVLNLMSSGDVYQNPFADITEYYKRYSRSQANRGKSIRDPTNKISKPTSGGVMRIKLGNLLENFKIDILHTISSQLDTMKIKRKQEEENVTLAIFCHRCRRKHPEKECPLNVIEICGICTENHPTNECPSLPRLKAMFKGGGEPATSYLPRRPWRQENPSMFANTITQYPQQQWVPPMSYPQWSTQTQPWQQGWRGPVYGNVPFQPTNFPTYPQYPSNISKFLLGFNPPALLPPRQPQQPLALPMNPNMQQLMQVAPIQSPPRPTPISTQPIPNPNNRPTKPIQNVEVQTFPTYVITPTPFNGIELRSGRIVNKTNPTMVIQEEQVHNHTNQEEQINVQMVQRE
jgi:hypothetical protein